MLIDWFTVVAQVVNFLILVLLLRRFLYKPILRSIEERKKTIAAQFEEAQSVRKEAEQRRVEFEEKNSTFDDERDAMLDKVRKEVAAERESLLTAARKEADQLRAQFLEAVRGEEQAVNTQITARAREEVFYLARKVLTDLASKDINEGLFQRFIEHLSGMDGQQRDPLRKSLVAGDHRAVLRSSSSLHEEQSQLLADTLHKLLDNDVTVASRTADDLIGGFELLIGDHRISWTFADYLETIEHANTPAMQD